MKRHWILRAVRTMAFVAAAILITGAAVMVLWNALVPAIFGGAPITWVQALGLLVLTRLLIGGGRRARWAHRGADWRKRWEARVANMSPQEREKWKAEFGGYCCGGSRFLPTSRADERTPTPAKAEA